MAHKIDFSYLDFDNAGMTLSFPAGAAMVQATFTGPLTSVTVAPAASAFTLNKAQLDTIGFGWGQTIVVDVTMTDASVQQYEFIVDGQPPILAESIVDGAVTADFSFLLAPDTTSPSKLTMVDIINLISANPAGTLYGIRLTVDDQFSGNSMEFARNESSVTVSKTINVNGEADIIFYDKSGISEYVDNWASLFPLGGPGYVEVGIGTNPWVWNIEFGLPADDLLFTVRPNNTELDEPGTATGFLTQDTAAVNSITGNPLSANPGYNWDVVEVNPDVARVLETEKTPDSAMGTEYQNGALAGLRIMGAGAGLSVVRPSTATYCHRPAWEMAAVNQYEHLRGEEVLYRIANLNYYLSLSPSSTELLVGAYDSNTGQWWYAQSSGVLGADEVASDQLVPGATRNITFSGLTGPITYWAICPIKGEMSAINYGETIEVDDGLGGTTTQTCDHIAATDPNFRLYHHGILLQEGVDVTWAGSPVININVDTLNISGLGPEAYAIQFI